ncbi:response regulator [Candidatus Woesearchaeota archaeon]|nr:response regulator [Candidatus Woesearchaeota archaeon]
MRYLIVEDDFSDVTLTKLRLKRIGYEVTVVYPEDAIRENKDAKPAIIQLDGLEGRCFGLHQQMKQDNPDARYILFSSRSELYGKAAKAGMEVFDKSRGDNDLCEYVKNFIER